MEMNEFIAAIDLGTSKIVGMIGSKSVSGTLTIHAIEKEDSGSCIKRGQIQNVEDASIKIKKVITKLENRISAKIGKIYLGVGGQSIHSIDNFVSRQFMEDTLITEELVQEMIQDSYKINLNNTDILEVVPLEYTLDGKPEKQPIGIFCSEIEVAHKLIVGRNTLKKNLKWLEERIKIPVAGYIVSPLATAEAVLTNAEKSLGCALIDFGAGTTTVQIYKNGLLQYLVIIPFGGSTITRDISSLQILEPAAEKLKTMYGNAIYDSEAENKILRQQNSEGIDSPEIELHILSRVIEARTEEIIENVLEQIKESGLDKQLSAGIIITGGASQMKGLTELLKKKTDMEVKYGYVSKIVNFTTPSENQKNIAYTQVIGLLLLGKENCYKPKEDIKTTFSEPAANHKKDLKDQKSGFSGLFGKIKGTMTQLLDENDSKDL